EAWTWWETDLARGLLDDLSARQLRPLTAEERRREADLTGQLQRLDEQIDRPAAKARPTRSEEQPPGGPRQHRGERRRECVAMQNELGRKYRAAAGKASTLEDIQASLPPGVALAGWVDVRDQHWACVVKREGAPAWVEIPGSGPGGAWAQEEARGGEGPPSRVLGKQGRVGRRARG